MEELSVFICGRCHWECGRAQAAASAPLEVELWQDISASEDVASVTCPRCRAELIQCCHCPLNFCKADPETQKTITERKQSVLVWGKEHINSSHRKGKMSPRVEPKRRDTTHLPDAKERGIPLKNFMLPTAATMNLTHSLAAGVLMSAVEGTSMNERRLPGISC